MTADREPIFDSPDARRMLREAIAATRRERPFELMAIVLLPEHVHAILGLPDGDSDFSKQWSIIKGRFSHAFLADGGIEADVTASQSRHRGRGVWQSRIFDHLIRDQDDFNRHLDYIHYNPVKHGLVACPHAWAYSTFDRWVSRGGYEHNWCCACDGVSRKAPSFEWTLGRSME